MEPHMSVEPSMYVETYVCGTFCVWDLVFVGPHQSHVRRDPMLVESPCAWNPMCVERHACGAHAFGTPCVLNPMCVGARCVLRWVARWVAPWVSRLVARLGGGLRRGLRGGCAIVARCVVGCVVGCAVSRWVAQWRQQPERE